MRQHKRCVGKTETENRYRTSAAAHTLDEQETEGNNRRRREFRKGERIVDLVDVIWSEDINGGSEKRRSFTGKFAAEKIHSNAAEEKEEPECECRRGEPIPKYDVRPGKHVIRQRRIESDADLAEPEICLAGPARVDLTVQ